MNLQRQWINKFIYQLKSIAMKFLKQHFSLLLIAAVIFSIPAKAQLIAQKTLSLEAAKKIVAAAVVYAKEKNAPGGAIAIVDNGGNLIYLERLDGTFAASAEVAIKKAN